MHRISFWSSQKAKITLLFRVGHHDKKSLVPTSECGAAVFIHGAPSFTTADYYTDKASYSWIGDWEAGEGNKENLPGSKGKREGTGHAKILPPNSHT